MNTMPKVTTARYCPAWFVQAAELMVRNSISFKAAALEVGHPLEPDEADKTSRRRDFQEILRGERNKYYTKVANEPTRTKSVAIGKMEVLIDKLMVDGEYDKAATAIEKLAKLEGWVGGDSNVNIFAGLNARDIAEARERIQSQITDTKKSDALFN